MLATGSGWGELICALKSSMSEELGTIFCVAPASCMLRMTSSIFGVALYYSWDYTLCMLVLGLWL